MRARRMATMGGTDSARNIVSIHHFVFTEKRNSKCGLNVGVGCILIDIQENCANSVSQPCFYALSFTHSGIWSQTTSKAKRSGSAAKRLNGGDDDEEDEQGNKDDDEEEEDEDEESPLGPFYPGQFVSALYDRLQQLHCMFALASIFFMLTQILPKSWSRCSKFCCFVPFCVFFSLDISKQNCWFTIVFVCSESVSHQSRTHWRLGQTVLLPASNRTRVRESSQICFSFSLAMFC